MKQAIVSAAFGVAYQELAEVTWPSQRAYASRIGSEFITIEKRLFPGASGHWEKLQLRSFLDAYERVLWLDCDVIVRSDCPDLFLRVPAQAIGAWDESRSGPWDYRGIIVKWAGLAGLTDISYPGWHFNSGVLVVSRCHANLFDDPPGAFPGYELLWDQGWLNFGAARDRIAFAKMGKEFNHTFLSSGNRLNSHVIHYCGTLYGSGYAQDILPGTRPADLIRLDLARWKAMGF